MSDIKNFDNLTPQEREFAELYVDGDLAYAGDPLACYRKAFGCNTRYDVVKARTLLTRKDIQEYMVFLDCPEEAETIEARVMRRKITKKLMKIGDSCADLDIVDRRGNQINPASLRSVSINAYKLVAELNGIKKGTVDAGDGAGENANRGITFNVIVPQSATEVKAEHEDER